MDSFLVGMDLVMYLAMPQIQARPRVGLTSTLNNLMDSYLEKYSNEAGPPSTPVRSGKLPLPTTPDELSTPLGQRVKKKCRPCLNKIQGDGQKAKKNNLYGVKSRCELCFIPICQEHSKLVCKPFCKQ